MRRRNQRQTKTTTNRVRNITTGTVTFHSSHRAAMVEVSRQRVIHGNEAVVRMDNLTNDGRWWNPGEGYLDA